MSLDFLWPKSNSPLSMTWQSTNFRILFTLASKCNRVSATMDIGLVRDELHQLPSSRNVKGSIGASGRRAPVEIDLTLRRVAIAGATISRFAREHTMKLPIVDFCIWQRALSRRLLSRVSQGRNPIDYQGKGTMMRKCVMVCLALGMLLSAAQTEARVNDKRRSPQQTRAQIEQSLRTCQLNCDMSEKRCRSAPCIGVPGLLCWADCTKRKWSCDDTCKKIASRPQQLQQPQQAQRPQQPTPNQDASRAFCQSGCSMSRMQCEMACGMKTDLLESTLCQSSCRTNEFSCQSMCR